MFEIELDFESFVKQAERMNAKIALLPEALATQLTHAAFVARRVLVDSTWPSHVTVRNRGFLTAALRVSPAAPDRLQVVIFDTLGRANLYAHAKGGIITPKHARRFAIPNLAEIRRTGSGARPTPRQIIQSTPKSRLWLTKDDLFVSEAGRLHLKYSFKEQVTIRKSVPFYEDFEFAINAEMRTGFQAAMRSAMNA